MKTTAQRIGDAQAALRTASAKIEQVWLRATPGDLPGDLFTTARQIDQDLIRVRLRLRDLADELAATKADAIATMETK